MTRRSPNRPQLQSPAELGQPWLHAHARHPILAERDDTTTEIWFPVNPVPLERARVVTRIDARGERRTRGITPPRSSAFYDELRWSWHQLPRPKPHYAAPTRLAITLELWRHLPAPNSQCGDLSNLVKAVEDALNGIAWTDDSQIQTIHATIRAAGRTVPGAIHLTIAPQHRRPATP